MTIHHLRNLQQVNLNLAQCNVIFGANGSGKTSILEAVFLLSRGKSFRHHQPKRYITHYQNSVVIHASFADGGSMAIQKQQDASTTLRLEQQTVYSQSPLTQRLPTLLIDPSSMELLETGSAARRQLIDWMAFHVKQGFHSQWLAYQRLLKQRNALLKSHSHIGALSASLRQELAAWDKGLANHAALITHYRQQVFDAWVPEFNTLIHKLLPHYADNIQLRFVAGYDTDYSLDELLQQRLPQDCQMGYTRIGCHRADIQVLWQQTQDDRPKDRSNVSAQYHAYQNSEDDDVDEVEKDKAKHIANNEDDRESKINTIHSIISNEINHNNNENNNSNNNNQKQTVNRHSEKMLVNSIFISTSDDDTTTSTIKEQAVNVLSRGEKKLLITALRLSQLPVLNIRTHDNDTQPSQHTASTLPTLVDDSSGPPPTPTYEGIMPVVMLDDISAELDDAALDILLTTLAQTPCQLFITSLSTDIKQQIQRYWQTYQLFHVKQGQVFEYIGSEGDILP